MKTYGYVLNVLSDLEVWEKIFEMSLSDDLHKYLGHFVNVDEITSIFEKYYISKEEIEKRIDSEINEIQKSINSFTPECGYAMFNQSQQELVIKVLNHVKEILK